MKKRTPAAPAASTGRRAQRLLKRSTGTGSSRLARRPRLTAFFLDEIADVVEREDD